MHSIATAKYMVFKVNPKYREIHCPATDEQQAEQDGASRITSRLNIDQDSHPVKFPPRGTEF